MKEIICMNKECIHNINNHCNFNDKFLRIDCVGGCSYNTKNPKYSEQIKETLAEHENKED